jgi:hypothetical protein
MESYAEGDVLLNYLLAEFEKRSSHSVDSMYLMRFKRSIHQVQLCLKWVQSHTARGIPRLS